MKYETKHVILLPDRQHDLGAVVDDKDFSDKAEVERLLRLKAIEPLKGSEGYVPTELRPDQGSDPTPRGAVSPDWFAAGLTPDEIDAQIAALQAQKESAVQTQAKLDEADAAANPDAPRRSRPRVSDTAQA